MYLFCVQMIYCIHLIIFSVSSELTEEQIRNQNGARLLSKTFVQQQYYFVTGYVFETERLTFQEQEYLKNINEKVRVCFEC